MKETELKPCPFYGGEVELVDYTDRLYGFWDYKIKCKKCRAYIEEMARTLCGEKEKTCEDCDSCDSCEFWIEASVLYNAGYRKQEWISVEDRLPEDVYGKDRKQIVVLVHTKSGRISSASRVRMSKWDKTKLKRVKLDTLQWSRGLRVTHWMPLPDAPKGVNNG